MMFNFFRLKDVCLHEMHSKDVYFHHELTEYVNSSDSISIIEVKKCKKCSFTEEKTLSEEYFPVNNKDSYKLKQEMLSLLKRTKVQSKDEYILKKAKELAQ